MKVGALITSVDSKMPNSYSDQDKVDWINDLEKTIFNDSIEKQTTSSIDLVKDQQAYAMPTGYAFEDLIKVTVNGTEYEKRSMANHTANTFFNSDGDIALDPTPTEDSTGGIVTVYRWKPTAKTVAGKTTEDLELPDRFTNLYRYYLYAMIAMHNKEFGESNNWTVMYNTELGALLKWWQEVCPKDNVESNKKGAANWGRW